MMLHHSLNQLRPIGSIHLSKGLGFNADGINQDAIKIKNHPPPILSLLIHFLAQIQI